MRDRVAVIGRLLTAGLLMVAVLGPLNELLAQASAPRMSAIAERSGYRISSWKNAGLDHQNQLYLVKAAVEGKPDGMILFATEMGATDRVIRGIAALGGELMARFDEVGYFRARLPLKQFAKAQAIPGVLIAMIEGGALTYSPGLVSYPEPKKSKADSLRADSVRKDSLVKDSLRVAALPLIPDAARAAESPYVAFNEMRSYDLRKQDARFDGRGVTIAVLEYGLIDVLHPALQKALTADGRPIRKLRGVITPYSYDPDFVQPDMLVGGSTYADFDKNRVRRTRTVTATSGSFIVDDSTYKAADGVYSFGKFPRGKTSHAVIWDDARKVAWIDANGDKSFVDEKAMEDINTSFSVGMIKALDSTAKEPKRTVSFAIQFDSVPHAVRIHEGTAGHQTMVTSVAAASGLFGAADASAPGAQIMIIDAGRTLYSYLEAWVRAARDPRVDLITSSQIGGTLMSAGEGLLALVMNRLIEVHGKPFFAGSHNSGPSTTTGGEPSMVPRVLSIGGYASASTYKAQYGWTVPDKDYLVSYSSRGPSTNGGAKPDVLAPVMSVAATPCTATSVQHTFIFRYPECYQIGGGTSSAGPHAAGAGALLISAARQSGLPTDVRHIAWALRMGARFLPNYPSHEQGAGLVDVVRSYELLKLAKEKGLDIPDIETRAPVRTVLSKLLRDPGLGNGLYEREGWKAGDVGTRTIRLTRRTGPAGPVTYALGWRGNDGTFSAVENTVTLPLDVPVEVPIRLAPKASGMHSALLLVVDQKGNVPVHHVLTTVVAADRLTPSNAFAVRYRERVPWPRAKSFFVDVPPGTASLRLDLAVSGGRVKLSTHDLSIQNTGSRETGRSYRYATYKMSDWVYPGQHGTHVIADPEPGVMEILVEPFATSGGADSARYNVPSEFELTASVQRARGAVAQAAASGTPAAVSFANLQGAVAEPRIMAEVGARRVLRGTAGGAEIPTTYYINVDSGTTTLRVEATADNPADQLTFYLYDCAGAKCALWDLTLRDGPRQSLLVTKPRAGAWKVVVDAVSKNANAGFTYTEIMTSPKFGSVDRDNQAAQVKAGNSYSSTVAFTATGTPRVGYSSVGVADLVDEAVERAEREHPIGRFAPHLVPQRPTRLGTVVVPLRTSTSAADGASSPRTKH
jgi:hypothetical protein